MKSFILACWLALSLTSTFTHAETPAETPKTQQEAKKTEEPSTLKQILDLLAGVGTLISGVAAVAAIYVAYRLQQNQLTVSQQLHNSQQTLSQQLHKSQQTLSQRQLIVPLWDHISALTRFDPNNPITPDAIKIVNTLELVAICCEGGMIDEQVILRTFNEQFLSHYESIKKCRTSLPGLNIDGEKLLLENRAAVEYYRKLDTLRVSAGRITP